MKELIFQSLFVEIAALLALAAVIGLVGNLLRQPLIVSFIAAGIVAGPSVLDIARSTDKIAVLSELGIAVLLFLVGLKLDIKLVRSLGGVALMTGLGQVVFTAAAGYLICVALGLSAVTSAYVAVALTFSSTIIIVKLLSDKRETEALHGQIALGFLIVQDIVVVLAMIALSAVGIGTQAGASPGDIARVLVSSVGVLAAVLLFVRYLATPMTERLARSPELLLLFTIALAAAFAATGEQLGFGKELGGLLAGVSLASTPYREAIAARLAPLRDFLLLFFFVALGTRLNLDLNVANFWPAVILSLFVLIGNPLIVMAIMGSMGYQKRTGFLAGLTVAQISEFSLVFMAMGVTLGHVNDEALGLVTLIGLITIATSTYMITYSHVLYRLCEPLLGGFERRNTVSDDAGDASRSRFDAVVIGAGRYGAAIARRLEKRGKRVLIVDFNPAVVRAWRARGGSARYGDGMDPEFVAALPLGDVQWFISAIPSHDTGVTHEDPRVTVAGAVRAAGFRGRVAIMNRTGGDPAGLIAAGADLVLDPIQDAADEAVELMLSEARPERQATDTMDEQKGLRD